MIDASKADDMYEILAAMDASLTHMPVFIYADDIEQYIKDGGSLLWNLSEDTSKAVSNNKRMTPNLDLILPFSIAKNNEELEKNILEFDIDEYLKKINDYEKGVDLIFDGKASERVVEKIVNKSRQ